MSIVWLTCAWLRSCDERSQGPIDRVTTKSLFSDHHITMPVRLDSRSSSSPPGWVDECAGSILRRRQRSSRTHIPFFPVRNRLRPTLPHAPAVENCWAERHDGQRDLYIQHAA
jgi:hypothetical protein